MKCNLKKPIKGFIYVMSQFSACGEEIVGEDVVDLLHNVLKSNSVANHFGRTPIQRIDVPLRSAEE